MLQEHLALLHRLDTCSLMEDETLCGIAFRLSQHAHALILHHAGRSEAVFAMMQQEAGHTLHVHALTRIPCHTTVRVFHRCRQILTAGASEISRRRSALIPGAPSQEVPHGGAHSIFSSLHRLDFGILLPKGVHTRYENTSQPFLEPHQDESPCRSALLWIPRGGERGLHGLMHRFLAGADHNGRLSAPQRAPARVEDDPLALEDTCSRHETCSHRKAALRSIANGTCNVASHPILPKKRLKRYGCQTSC